MQPRSVEQEFAQLAAAARPRVAAVAARLVGADEAEDVVQEALLRAYLGLSSLRDPSRFVPWLCGIAVNVAKMRLRTRVARERAAAGAANGAAAVGEPELLELVRDAVEVLPPGQREVVLLHYVDDLSCEEVARLLGTSPGAVRVRLHRARRELQRQLAPSFVPITTREEEPMLEMTIGDVLVRIGDDGSAAAWDGNVVVLCEREGEGLLPIWIGAPEGHALAARLQDHRYPRPMTADLLVEIVRALGGEVRGVAITRLEENVFYGTIDLGGSEVDARPSDALNLAVRTGAPIRVAEAVLEEAGIDEAGLEEKLEREMISHGIGLPPGRWGSLTGALLEALRPPGRK